MFFVFFSRSRNTRYLRELIVRKVIDLFFQDKVYKELKEAKEKLGDAEFDSTDLAELTYLNCVIKGIIVVVCRLYSYCR